MRGEGEVEGGERERRSYSGNIPCGRGRGFCSVPNLWNTISVGKNSTYSVLSAFYCRADFSFLWLASARAMNSRMLVMHETKNQGCELIPCNCTPSFALCAGRALYAGQVPEKVMKLIQILFSWSSLPYARIDCNLLVKYLLRNSSCWIIERFSL